MLLQEKIITKWNSKTKKYYENLGYLFTFMGDDLEILMSDLPKNSSCRVLVSCDYCGSIYSVSWAHRTQIVDNATIKKDCCKKCGNKKAQEVFDINYGPGKTPMSSIDVRNKLRDVFIEKYGVENPFQSEEVKRKIIDANIEKYGVPYYNQTKEGKEKIKNTLLERYGFENWMFIPENKGIFSGSCSPVWKGGIHDERWDRLQKEYREWRISVFLRDSFVCKKCSNHSSELEAHHIINWKDNKETRYDIDNGITFCKNCHIAFHRIYGKKNNNYLQVIEFLS